MGIQTVGPKSGTSLGNMEHKCSWPIYFRPPSAMKIILGNIPWSPCKSGLTIYFHGKDYPYLLNGLEGPARGLRGIGRMCGSADFAQIVAI